MLLTKPTFIMLLLISSKLIFFSANTTARTSQKPTRPPSADYQRVTLPLPLKLLWLDNEVDPLALSSREQVSDLMQKAADAGFNVIVPDARNWHGLAFYDSKIADKPVAFKGKPYPQDFDFLRTVVEEAHSRGLKVHAGLNVFTEGAKADPKTGAGHRHRDWQAVVYDTKVRVQHGDSPPVFAKHVNDRDTSGTAVYTAKYPSRLHRLNSPQNAVDGVHGKTASRWVSADTSTIHWLDLKWPAQQDLTSATIHFTKGFPESFRLLAGTELIVEAPYNGTIECRIDLTSGSMPLKTNHLRLEFPVESRDPVARVEEFLVYSSAKNVAAEAVVTADSMRTEQPSLLLGVKDGKVTTSVLEDKLPAQGFDPTPFDQVLVENSAPDSVSVGATLKIFTETIMPPEADAPGGLLRYMNPANPRVQERNLAIIDEVLSNYDVDGVILDRVRYDNFTVDFSDLSRALFERDMKVKVKQWPQDVFIPADPLTGEDLKKGPLYDKWLTWRAMVIRGFIHRARDVVRQHPGKALGDYVGSWYETYWQVGANWAVESYDPAADYKWAPPDYRKAGYAQVLDYLSPGVYYSAVGKQETPDPQATIEGAIDLTRRVTRGSVPLAPGLYVPNLKSNEAYEAAVRLCIQNGGGVMIFSHSTLESLGRWEATRRGLQATQQFLE